MAGNLRMLLTCKNPILQQESQSNLRTILSREPNSQTKLPRFSTLIKIDLTHEDEILKKRKFLGKLNIPKETQNLDFPSRDVKDLVDILNLSPDYDVISRKNALEQLTLVMESKKSSLSFLEFNGANILQHLMDKCLDETTNFSSLLFPLIQCIKGVLIYNLNAFQHEKLLYGLTRLLFLFHDNAQVLDEVIMASVLVLYNGWLKVEDLNLTLPTFLANNLDFPVKVRQ